MTDAIILCMMIITGVLLSTTIMAQSKQLYMYTVVNTLQCLGKALEHVLMLVVMTMTVKLESFVVAMDVAMSVCLQ